LKVLHDDAGQNESIREEVDEIGLHEGKVSPERTLSVKLDALFTIRGVYDGFLLSEIIKRVGK
jgi:hypothetical protein